MMRNHYRFILKKEKNNQNTQLKNKKRKKFKQLKKRQIDMQMI